MNINDISTQLLYTTVPVFSIQSDKSITSGTGFIFSINESDNTSIPFLITNYHVLATAETGYIELHLSENNLPTKNSVKVSFDKTVISGNKLGALDLLAIPLAGTLTDLQQKGKSVFYRTVDQQMIPSVEQQNNLAAVEEIYFIGYPCAIYDRVNQVSIIRKGITATPIWNDFQGESMFLVDAGVFGGSSGSPVFIFNQGSYPTASGITIGNRLLFVGVITATMRSADKDYLGLGKAINSKALLDEINKHILSLKQNRT